MIFDNVEHTKEEAQLFWAMLRETGPGLLVVALSLLPLMPSKTLRLNVRLTAWRANLQNAGDSSPSLSGCCAVGSWPTNGRPTNPALTDWQPWPQTRRSSRPSDVPRQSQTPRPRRPGTFAGLSA